MFLRNLMDIFSLPQQAFFYLALLNIIVDFGLHFSCAEMQPKINKVH
ncbi:hypothetical protein B14911_24696 [Bacillus sp. NRRL B-14911]|nr:hypothetical protein B14911_24696 [Bacillus sp. NRRL B-14911]